MKKPLIPPLLLFLMLIKACGPTTDPTNKQENMNIAKKLEIFTLTNKDGAEVKITNLGGKIMALKVPDKNGTLGDVVLGYEHPEAYINGNPYFGALIGRYANRIEQGRFTLDSNTYQLPTNDGPHHLHGGPGGFHNVIWDVEPVPGMESQKLKLTYLSVNGEQGYPGNLKVKVHYTWTDNYELRIDYLAATDRKTIVNLTHHAFFNLKDGGESSILDHQMMINAGHFTPVDSGLIPTGEIRSVKGTPMDFTDPKRIGADIEKDGRQLAHGKGYDHNWVLDQQEEKDSLRLAARVYEPTTQRVMEVYTTEPGLQFYSGNFLDGSDVGKDSTVYEHRNAFCLEAQHFPDSPHHPNFPSTVLKPEEKYTQTTIYKFSTKK